MTEKQPDQIQGGAFTKDASPLAVYRECMGLAKQRLVFSYAQTPEAPHWLRIETTALNIRKVVEAVAFGCLAAADLQFGDVASRYKHGWKADKQIQHAIRRDQGSYPTPANIHLNFDTRRHHLEREIGFVLSPDELVAIWNDVGNVLHEHNPFKEMKRIDEWHIKIERYLNGLEGLLWRHMVHVQNNLLVADFGQRDQQPPVIYHAISKADGTLSMTEPT